jgi:anaphase-promoting complex subunit 2
MGATIMAAFTCTFQTHIYSVLPPIFSQGFKSLIAFTFTLSSTPPRPSPLSSPSSSTASSPPDWLLRLFPPPPDASRSDHSLWATFEALGLVERYESLILSVCYEHIENYVVETCKGVWDRHVLIEMREWMAREVVPWLIMPYAREARTRKFCMTC